MKSKRAKEHISMHQRYLRGDEVNLYIHISRATNAVELAEQDAEERHAKEIRKLKVELFNAIKSKFGIKNAMVITAEAFEKINNGG